MKFMYFVAFSEYMSFNLMQWNISDSLTQTAEN